MLIDDFIEGLTALISEHYVERGLYEAERNTNALLHKAMVTAEERGHSKAMEAISEHYTEKAKYNEAVRQGDELKEALNELQKYNEVEAELQRAKNIHPDWPDDLYVQLAVMQEEAGEVTKAILDFSFHKGPAGDIKKELIQTAAMCMRMLEDFEAAIKNTER
jgi:lipopolysaccharide biosynthesis regulator YciM